MTKPAMYGLLLFNTQKKTWHPILFRPAPRPSDADASKGAVVRHKSVGHHSEGFANKADAEKWITEEPALKYDKTVLEWDGTHTPAMMLDFEVL